MIRRFAIALVIAVGVYGIALGIGTLLYQTGAIGTGATHNDCDTVKADLARARGVSEEDIPQADVKAATRACLDAHELTKWEAFRSEYLFWSVWPGIILAGLFLLWPWWTRVLHHQEIAEAIEEASRLEMGT